MDETLVKINQDKQKVQLLVAANVPPGGAPEGIVIKGLLEKSAVFTEENKNQRFLVLDDENRITCYAVSAATGLELKDFVGKKVSMLGQAEYDPSTRKRILRVTNIIEQAQTFGIRRISVDEFLSYIGWKGEVRTVGLGKGADSKDFLKPQSGASSDAADAFRERRPPERGAGGAF